MRTYSSRSAGAIVQGLTALTRNSQVKNSLLAALKQDLWEIVEPVEGEMPRLHIRLRRRDAGRRRWGDAGQRRVRIRRAA